jgi:hypothetical protein
MVNYGLIEGQRKDDYLGGTLPYEVRLESGDWTPYLPKGEWQYKNGVDTMACVTFSALNAIETQYKFLTGTERNFSDRFTARMSGTTSEGNYLFRVTDSIRRDGLVDESVWPSPENFTWETYYTTPPIEVINQARTFLDDFVVQYEWIDVTRDSLIHHLKHSPIQVTIPGHAILNFYTTADVQKYFDSYEPFIKERTEPFVSAMKIVLTRKITLMTKDEVRNLYRLAFYREPTEEESNYWTGKALADFLKTAIADRSQFLSHE